jgi:TolA-binding protein
MNNAINMKLAKYKEQRNAHYYNLALPWFEDVRAYHGKALEEYEIVKRLENEFEQLRHQRDMEDFENKMMARKKQLEELKQEIDRKNIELTKMQEQIYKIHADNENRVKEEAKKMAEELEKKASQEHLKTTINPIVNINFGPNQVKVKYTNKNNFS